MLNIQTDDCQTDDRLLAAMQAVPELQPYLDRAFLAEVQVWVDRLQSFASPELDKLALIRALEVTNGCCQWGFRRQRDQALSAEATRQAMQFVMGSIKQQRIVFPANPGQPPEPPIEFDLRSQQFMAEVRSLYLDAFKNHVPGADRQFYASSLGQFLALGRERMETALHRVQEQCLPLFGPYWMEKGRMYCEPYLKVADVATAG
jgi:hypothetical protein